LVPYDEACEASLQGRQRRGRISPVSSARAAGGRASRWKKPRGAQWRAIPDRVEDIAPRSETTDRFLLWCARSRTDDEAKAGARELVEEGIDWERLLALAARHRLLALLYPLLRDLDGEQIPKATLSRTEAAYYTNLRRNVLLQHELGQIVGSLREEGVEVIVLKGGALAWTVYASPALRPMTDLDLLVRPEQMKQLGLVVEALGFHRSESLPAHMVSFQERFGGGAVWIRERNGKITGLDVQSDLAGVNWCRRAFPVEEGALWEAARPLDLGETAARQLSAVDALIHLCLHPALHHGYAYPLIGYVDIDRLVCEAGSDPLWTRLIERARRFRIKTVVYWGLMAAHDLLETPVPAEVLGELAPHGVRLHLLRRLAPLDHEVVLQGARKLPTGARQVLLYATLADRLQDAWRMLWSIIFPDLEWLTVRYALEGKGHARLYRLVHAFRVGRALVRGLYRPLAESSLE
jgi:hypothetical protein